MRLVLEKRRKWLLTLLLLGFGQGVWLVSAQPTDRLQPAAMAVTNVLQLHQEISRHGKITCDLNLEGDVCAVAPGKSLFVLRDATGAELFGGEFPGVSPQAGNRVRLAGQKIRVTRGVDGLRVGPDPLIDNDGVHGLRTQSNAVYLAAGRHAIRLQWFNYNGPLGLEAAYAGPGIARQAIPAAALSHDAGLAAAGGVRQAAGLQCRCFEGDWVYLPDFASLSPVTNRIVPSLSADAKTRADGVGLEFSGQLTVPRAGVYEFFITSDDGSRLFIDGRLPGLSVLDPGVKSAPAPTAFAPGSRVMRDADESQWATVEGTVVFACEQAGRVELALQCGADWVQGAVADTAGLAKLLHRRVRLTGVCQNVRAIDGRWVFGRITVPGARQVATVEALPAPPAADAWPVLTTAAQVQSLKREEALRGNSVRIRGTLTCASPWAAAAILQDDTRGIYVDNLAPLLQAQPRAGDFMEIEGVANPGDFSPTVIAQKAVRRGVGRMPAPVHPSWDQLMNGSLDAQYVEIQGVITAVESNRCAFLTQGGKIDVELQGVYPNRAELRQYEKRLVRIRGCLLARWDGKTRQVVPGEIRIGDPAISAEDMAAEDPFAAPAKRIAELMIFDAQASALQRVKVSGQVVYVRETLGCVMDGPHGMRFALGEPASLQPGDRVEMAGYPELGGPSPRLREALVRKTGAGPLPEAVRLAPSDVWRNGLDATRVCLEGVLVFQQRNAGEHWFQLQTGPWVFMARLNEPVPAFLSIPIGSRLAVTGVYAGQGAKPPAGRMSSAFELLLNSPADIQVLARPSWWTLRRILSVLGILSMVPLGAMVWAFTLRRKVRMQTEIIRQKLQHEATLEERTRIAREFHDTLEQALAGIGMQLNALAGKAGEMPPESRRILEMTCSMVRHSQDEARRSVQELRSFDLERGDLASALSELVVRSKESSTVDFRFQAIGEAYPLSSRVELHLLRIGQEAVANALKHANARQVCLTLAYGQESLKLSVIDDGRGFDTQKATASEKGHFGLLGMRERAEKAGGTLSLASAPGRGTVIEVTVPCHSIKIEQLRHYEEENSGFNRG